MKEERQVAGDGALVDTDLAALTATADTAAEAILSRVRDAGLTCPAPHQVHGPRSSPWPAVQRGGTPVSLLPDPELVQVAPGVHAYVQPDGSWMVNNTGIVSGIGGSPRHVLVDMTSTEARNRALLKVADRVGQGHRHALINTHHHGDHTYGNWLMPADVPIVAHTWCREDLLDSGLAAAQVLRGPDYGHMEVRPPDLTFTGSMTLHLGDRAVELHHVGPAHTRGDVIAWLPQERVLFAGDIAFAGGQPFLLEGSVAGYPAAIAAIRALEPEILIPGHGPVCHGDDVIRLLDDLDAYARFVAETAQDSYHAGRTPLDAALAAANNPFATWQESERLVGNLHRAYSELAGDPIGTRLALPPIWRDMETLHGGPIPCLA